MGRVTRLAADSETPGGYFCAEITKLGGTPCEGRRFLCNQLENLNRTLNLGLTERFAQGCLDPLPWERARIPTNQELAQQVQQAEVAVRATQASPGLEENLGSPFSPGLQPLATMPDVSSPSPAVGTTQLGLGSYTQASTSTELSASAALSLEPSQLALEGSSYPFLSSNPQVRINPEACYRWVKFAGLCRFSRWCVLLHSPFYAFLRWRAFERAIFAGSSIRVPAHGGSAQPCSRRYCPEAPSVLSSAHLVRIYETHS